MSDSPELPLNILASSSLADEKSVPVSTPVAKKAATKKRTAAKKAASKKTATKKAATKKTATKKSSTAKKAATKKSTAKKASTKAATKKTTTAANEPSVSATSSPIGSTTESSAQEASTQDPSLAAPPAKETNPVELPITPESGTSPVPTVENIPIPAIKRVVRKVSPRTSESGENTSTSPEETTSTKETHRNGRRSIRRGGRYRRSRDENSDFEPEKEELGPPVACEGLLEIYPKGYGFLRAKKNNFDTSKHDVFVPLSLIREYGLRAGHVLTGFSQQARRGPLMTKLESVNNSAPDSYKEAPVFEELTATFPDKRIHLETSQDRLTTRTIDIFAPIGRGQRGLIVAPPRSGKTTVLQHIAEALHSNHEEEIHLILLLIDERPEEVTELSRALPQAEVFASSNDSPPKKHLQMAEACIDRAKRLVEGGKHVFILMDSITRLSRAYNNATKGKGRTGSGGLDIRALEMPRKIFASARNTKEAGSLTIVATALVQTGSRMDDVIFQEFKGTGNMELVLDRRMAEKYIYPAVDIFKSGTRKEELLLPDIQIPKIHFLRRGLAGMWADQAMERLIQVMNRFPTNAQMLLEIKDPK